MKIKLITILLSLKLITLLSFGDFIPENNNNYKNSSSITDQCQLIEQYDDQAQEVASLFVFNALFANTASPYPTELWENRDNEQISIFDIAREIKSIVEVKDKVLNLNNTDDSDQAILLERLSQMEDIADRALVMEADKWKPNYVNELMKHIIGIRNAGISDLIPSAVDPSNCKDEDSVMLENKPENQQNTNVINPCDENGKRWTSLTRLTELNNQGPSIANYMQLHATDIELIKTWWASQLKSSWYPGCAAVKAFYSNQRTLDPKDYYWNSSGYYRESQGYQTAQDEYSGFWQKGASADSDMCYPATTNKEKAYIDAFTIWHAYVQEVLAKTKFHHNNPSNKELCLIRTNGKKAFKSNNITHFGTNNIIPSAAYDSFSLINIYGKGNSNMVITESLVPHHRVIHLYPLIATGTSDYHRDNQKDKITENVNWLIKNFYDENGSLLINRENPSSVEKFVEAFIYREYSSDQKEFFEKPFHKNGFVNFTYWELDLFDAVENIVLKVLPLLPEQLPSENKTETLTAILIRSLSQDVESNGYFQETEVVVLSGPDLPFDYFYNTDDNLSELEERLYNGEGACGYWPDINDLQQIGHLGGSTGALLYQNPKNGKKYVLKRGASEGHIREEALADRLYEVMGLGIPESRLYNSSESPVKVAAYLEDSKSLGSAYNSADDAEKQRLRKEISNGFVVDALLTNFDVVGLDMDNILIGDDGKAYRVDNGASFRYRSMGKLKNDTPDESRKRWNPSPIALWTLRDPKINPNCAEIFKDLTIFEITDKIRELSLFHSEGNFNYETNMYEEGPCLETFRGHQVLNNHPDIKVQTETRFKNFKKVADQAVWMKLQLFKERTAEEADRELREWVESQDWGPAF